jgi:uncharacterized RDD family membrane protein YckC
MSKEAYTPWSRRVLAFLIDWAPIWLVFVIPFVGLLIVGDIECLESMYGEDGDCVTPESVFWLYVQVFGLLPATVYFIANFCYRQGKTGQSIGKSVMKFKLISEKTGQPIGFGMAFVRELIYILANIIGILWLIAVLWPLWDDRRRTLVDMIVGTVCVPVDVQPPPPRPQPQLY